MKLVTDLSVTARVPRGHISPAPEPDLQRSEWSFLSGTLPAGVAFSRAGVAGHFDGAGVMRFATADQPRFDHHPISHALRGLMVEPEATNLLSASAEFNASVWINTWVVLTANATLAPDGTMTADRVADRGGKSGPHSLHMLTRLAASMPHTVSVFAKAAERRRFEIYGSTAAWAENSSAMFDLASGSVTSLSGAFTGAKITDVGGGWYRCEATGMSNAVTSLTGAAVRFGLVTDDGLNTYMGVAGLGLSLWRAQLEVGVGTSHLPTGVILATRAADRVRITTVMGVRDVRVTTEDGAIDLPAQDLNGDWWPAMTGPQWIKKIEVL